MHRPMALLGVIFENCEPPGIVIKHNPGAAKELVWCVHSLMREAFDTQNNKSAYLHVSN